jgi:hypothetical protein
MLNQKGEVVRGAQELADCSGAKVARGKLFVAKVALCC